MRPAWMVAALLLGTSCKLPTFDDHLVYACATDLDCGGGGFGCLSGRCCRPTGEEQCGDGVDNDCDGKIDGAGMRELCNGRDDDCDGAVDEGFDLQHSPENCGTCGLSCDAVTQYCHAGVCAPRPEIDCADGVDQDGNGAVDCADPSCELLSCGEGCQCKALREVEVNCGDGLDSDGDESVDCADSDCELASCGDGCTCVDQVRRETSCFDQQDNDGRNGADCADSFCEGQLCATGTTQRCSGGACLCNGRGLEVEEGARCGDGVDNDCDALTDCDEPGCDGQSCSPDGGLDCACLGIRKSERSCGNLADDDGDGLVDCADVVDCPERSTCSAVLRGFTRAGRCLQSQCITEFCFDGADNDGDGLADCADPDCFNASCQGDGALAPDGGPACLCVAMVKIEGDCGDQRDNDGDGLVDCKDVLDCPAGSACTRASNGQPGVCQASNQSCN